MKCRTEKFPIGQLAILENNINKTPPYQREGGLWNETNKKLFIDSIIKDYDIPKIYFNDLTDKEESIKYAIIDGKQRLETIWAFMKGKFLITDEKEGGDGISYLDFSEAGKEAFKAKSLDVVLVEKADEDDIEDLFSRLNNGITLSTGEKRNVIGGDMCVLIRNLSENNKFFTDRVRISNKRKVHYEIATRFLLIENLSTEHPKRREYDLTKKPLDSFVENNKKMSTVHKKNLLKKTEQAIKKPTDIFNKKDAFLTKHVFIQTYYLFIKHLFASYVVENKEIRKFLDEFDKKRQEDKMLDDSEREIDFFNFALQVQQGIGNKGSISERDRLLRKFYLTWHKDTVPKDKIRFFSLEERNLIWILSGKKCAICKRALDDFDEMQADHIRPHSKGGKTVISNGRALCGTCNSSKGATV